MRSRRHKGTKNALVISDLQMAAFRVIISVEVSAQEGIVALSHCRVPDSGDHTDIFSPTAIAKLSSLETEDGCWIFVLINPYDINHEINEGVLRIWLSVKI